MGRSTSCAGSARSTSSAGSARSALLLLADGRFPGGGHAHSGGLEAAVASGSVNNLLHLEAFLAGRLVTSGAVDAWLAAAACAGANEAALDAEAEARCPSPALRDAGRRLGRGLRRAAAQTWPALAEGVAQQQAVVVGVVARAAGLRPEDAALLPPHGLLAGGAAAAPRLLAVDTADVMAIALDLAGLADEVAAAGAAAAGTGTLADGPAWCAPLLELRAEDHARWEVRLFAS
jgi:urease accessory protein